MTTHDPRLATLQCVECGTTRTVGHDTYAHVMTRLNDHWRCAECKGTN